MGENLKDQVEFGIQKSLRGQLSSWAKPHRATWASPGPVEMEEKDCFAEENGVNVGFGMQCCLQRRNGVIQRLLAEEYQIFHQQKLGRFLFCERALAYYM